jgi:hypothetical protein
MVEKPGTEHRGESTGRLRRRDAIRVAGTTALASAAGGLLLGQPASGSPAVARSASVAAAEGPQVIEGGFISAPDGFAAAPDNVRHVLKYWHRPTVVDGQPALEYSSTATLVDFSGVDPAQIDPKVIAADCDLFKKIAQESPGQLREIVALLQQGTDESVAAAARVAEAIGATEEDFVRAGGGFIWLVVIAVAAGGCGGAMANKTAKASTFPKQPK